MNRTAVSSSSLASVGYDAGQSILEIEFQSGSVYEYFDVPQTVYDGLMAAGSLGWYFDEHVKRAGYRYRQVR
jgi:hypothetical protein